MRAFFGHFIESWVIALHVFWWSRLARSAGRRRLVRSASGRADVVRENAQPNCLIFAGPYFTLPNGFRQKPAIRRCEAVDSPAMEFPDMFCPGFVATVGG